MNLTNEKSTLNKVHLSLLLMNKLCTWPENKPSWDFFCLPWYTMVVPWYTMVVPWYFFIRDHFVVISLGRIAQCNKTEIKKLIIIFTEWHIFKSMHQCGKNQMAQYLAMAVQYFNYWSLLLDYRMPDTVTVVTFVHTSVSCIISMVQNMRSTECGSHVNNTTLVFSCWPQSSANAAWNGGKWIGMKIFNKKLLKCEK